MDFRSTNQDRAHYQGDIISNVSSGGVQNSSHGCHLTGGATGALFTAAGDEANIAITLAGKGTGNARIGNSSSPTTIVTASTFVLSSGSVLQVGSTAPFAGIVRFTDTAVLVPYFDTTNRMVMETTHTQAGVNSSHYIVANGVNLSTNAVIVNAFAGSTAGDIHLWLAKMANTSNAATDTATIQFTVYRF